MYEYLTDGIFTVCRYTPQTGPYFDAQVITSEYDSDESARAAAKADADRMYKSFLNE